MNELKVFEDEGGQLSLFSPKYEVECVVEYDIFDFMEDNETMEYKVGYMNERKGIIIQCSDGKERLFYYNFQGELTYRLWKNNKCWGTFYQVNESIKSHKFLNAEFIENIKSTLNNLSVLL